MAASSSSSAGPRRSGAPAAGRPSASASPSAAGNAAGNALVDADEHITNGVSLALIVRAKSLSLFEVGVAVFDEKQQSLEVAAMEDTNMWPNVESLLLQLSPEVLILQALDPKIPKQAKSRLMKLVKEALDEVEQIGDGRAVRSFGRWGG